MASLTKEQKIHYALRIGAALCFIGHGAFGIITKPIWVNYFGVFGIGHDLAYTLMPIIGTIDIVFGLIILFYPIRAVVAWLVIWALITAALRPLSGEPFAELIERAGNFGAPLALLILSGGGGKNSKEFLARISPDIIVSPETITRVTYVLRAIIFLLLAGHGWLNLIGKKALITEYTTLGFSDPIAIAQYIGTFEIIAALAILIRPVRPLIIGLFVWKIVSELFYLHYEIFELIERAGSYTALLALWLALDKVTVTIREPAVN